MPWIETIQVDSAEELIQELAPNGPRFGESHLNYWMFRGEQDWDVPLLPSIHRPDSWNLAQRIVAARRVPHHADCSRDSNLFRASVELELMALFIARADEAGLPIPEMTYQFGEWFSEYAKWLKTLRNIPNPFNGEPPLSSHVIMKGGDPPGWGTWPSRRIESLIALAAHYGLPTSLLDWTASPFIGAYFAATCIMRDLEQGKEVKPTSSVWALIRTRTGALNNFPEPHPQSFDKLWCYKSGNVHMHAQQGQFTCSRIEYQDFWKPFEAKGLQEIVAARMDFMLKHDNTIAETPALYRFQFPSHVYANLLFLLAKLGVKGNLLFPTYSGVAQSLIEMCQYN